MENLLQGAFTPASNPLTRKKMVVILSAKGHATEELPVASFAEASDAWCRFRNDHCVEEHEMLPNSGEIRRDGKKVGKVDYLCRTPTKKGAFETAVGPEASVGFMINKHGTPTLYLKYLCAGSWYWQHLNWSCRGGRASYYSALASVYRKVRRAGVFVESLHEMALGHPKRRSA
jgi:hypothetical protein